MPDHTISLMLDVDRDHRPTLLDGAVLPEGGAGERIVAVEHDLVFNEDLDFVRGTLSVRTASGDTWDLRVDGAAGGGFLAGGGYGGWHGKPRGTVTESERWSLDGSINPRGLDTPLTDRPAVFHSGSQAGTGVFEFAHTRSPRFIYRPARIHQADVHAVGR
jgi:hypothetical protein